MTEIIPFDYEGATVRVVLDEGGEPWFVATDIAKTLGYGDATHMTRRLDADEKGLRSVETPGGAQTLGVVSEPGLYAAILGSRTDAAKPFKRWVTHEVLPSIRKRGGYISPDATEDQAEALVRRARARMGLCQAARGLIQADHLEAMARIVLAQGLGEAPELAPAATPLYTQDFLAGKHLTKDEKKRVTGVFGKALKAAYVEAHGEAPGSYPLTLSNGQTKQVCAYTEADRPLMDRVWAEGFASRFGCGVR